ncbi:MAG: hypothetical protein IJM58_08385 [Muribaculaceae bacterium]|nr:hypothetical protein [Muribaculaceae bacterium]
MNRLRIIHLVLPVFLLAALPAFSQVTLSGSIQSDVLIPQDDEKIGTEHYDDKVLTNTYVDLKLGSKYVDAGGRFEFLQYPLPGYEPDLKGWGVPHFYIKGHYKNVELTVGDYYEQFGSGFILRTYEERSLGIDNALRGARLSYKPVEGVVIKALTGKQRRYWHHNDALVSGVDVEIGIEQFIKSLEAHDTRITVGGSWVNKHEDNKDDEFFVDVTHKLKLPKYVNAWDARLNLIHKGFSILAEYAQKSQDPTFDNLYHYGKGSVAMLSASYSQKGVSLLLQAKRSENMSFRSRRTMSGTSSFINHLPPFTHDQTYALPAQYPYATQFDGEWAFQAEAGYTFKKQTPLGGKYGTKVKVNFSHVRGLDQGELKNPFHPDLPMGSDGYKSSFFKMGDETYYQDIDVQIDKRFTRDFSLVFMYMNQRYNMTVVEGHGGMITSNILVADGKYKFSPKLTLRCELQYQFCKGDRGDWAFGLAELSWAPHWMFTVSDMWNCGESKIHFYQALVTYSLKSHRIQAGYGRTDAGYNCSGGVCRWVPATRGFTFSYNYTF